MAKSKSEEPEVEEESTEVVNTYHDTDIIDPETGEDRRQVQQRAEADAARAEHRASEEE